VAGGWARKKAGARRKVIGTLAGRTHRRYYTLEGPKIIFMHLHTRIIVLDLSSTKVSRSFKTVEVSCFVMFRET
jgi:hypothetical protein